jgi:hypothetical protein
MLLHNLDILSDKGRTGLDQCVMKYGEHCGVTRLVESFDILGMAER